MVNCIHPPLLSLIAFTLALPGLWPSIDYPWRSDSLHARTEVGGEECPLKLLQMFALFSFLSPSIDWFNKRFLCLGIENKCLCEWTWRSIIQYKQDYVLDFKRGICVYCLLLFLSILNHIWPNSTEYQKNVVYYYYF